MGGGWCASRSARRPPSAHTSSRYGGRCDERRNADALAPGIVVLSEPVLGNPLIADCAHISALIRALPHANQRDNGGDESEPDDDPNRTHERTPSRTCMTSVSIVPSPAELIARRTQTSDIPH